MGLTEVIEQFRFENVAWGRLTIYLLVSMVITGNLATYLRYRRGWRDGYARKLNHMGHGFWAALTIAFLPPAELVPTITVATIAVAVIYGISAVVNGPWFLRGIVQGSFRDRDVPREKFFFFLPLILGNVGIVSAFSLFPPDAARAAILVVAIGDGLAEPIGLKFGASTTYKVRDLLFRTKNTKSIPGNAAVALSAVAVAIFTLWGYGDWWQIGLAALGFGMLMAAVEAVSPRGLDNLLLVLVGATYTTGVLSWSS